MYIIYCICYKAFRGHNTCIKSDSRSINVYTSKQLLWCQYFFKLNKILYYCNKIIELWLSTHKMNVIDELNNIGYLYLCPCVVSFVIAIYLYDISFQSDYFQDLSKNDWSSSSGYNVREFFALFIGELWWFNVEYIYIYTYAYQNIMSLSLSLYIHVYLYLWLYKCLSISIVCLCINIYIHGS